MIEYVTFDDKRLQVAAGGACAEKLDLSASRITKQVQTIFSKLGINRKDQLAKFVW